jgi:hypothetical protein
MSHSISSSSARGLPERAIVAFALFYAGVVFCLPVPVSEDVVLPWWASSLSIGRIQLHEAVFLVWVLFYGFDFLLKALLNRGIPGRQAALWLVALALWCGVVSLGAPLISQDLGRTLRLLVNAALLVSCVRWARQMGNLPLLALVGGFFAGTVVNLIVTFQNPFIVNDVMRLSGQNTPGVAMGVGIQLCAWLFFRARNGTTRTLALMAAAVFAFGCGLSYSRVGWFAGALGLAAWAYLLFGARARDLAERIRLRKARRVWIPLLLIGSGLVLSHPLIQEAIYGVRTLVVQKFNEDQSEQSNNIRLAYAVGVAEILAEHPIGVGYSGFFDAMTSTAVYESGRAAQEVDYTANPHSTFLYYASAGSLPGAVMIIGVFLFLLHSMRCGLVFAMGRPGNVFFALAAPSYLAIGVAVPYLVNSIILIVPAAIAAGWGWRRRSERAAVERLAMAHS